MLQEGKTPLHFELGRKHLFNWMANQTREDVTGVVLEYLRPYDVAYAKDWASIDDDKDDDEGCGGGVVIVEVEAAVFWKW